MEEVADHLRALLRDVICGHLDFDLPALADELIAAQHEDVEEDTHTGEAAAESRLPEPEPEPERRAGAGARARPDLSRLRRTGTRRRAPAPRDPGRPRLGAGRGSDRAPEARRPAARSSRGRAATSTSKSARLRATRPARRSPSCGASSALTSSAEWPSRPLLWTRLTISSPRDMSARGEAARRGTPPRRAGSGSGEVTIRNVVYGLAQQRRRRRACVRRSRRSRPRASGRSATGR